MICFLLVCCKEKSNNEVIITGQLEGVEDGIVIKLMKMEGGELTDMQAATIESGNFKFSFVDTLGRPKSMIIMAEGEGFPPAWLDVWITPGADIKITGQDKLIRTWEVNSTVAEQIELNKYKDKISSYEKITQSLMRDAISCFDEMDKSPEKSDFLLSKIDSIFAINDSVSLLTMKTEISLMDENRTYSSVWIEKLERYASSIKFVTLPDDYTEKLKNMYESMSEELKKSEEGKTIQANLYQPAIGN